MGRISRGFRLAGASWRVLMADKELLLLPLLSFVGMVTVLALVTGIGWAGGLLDEASRTQNPLFYVLIAALYFLCYFVAIFFNAAVVAAAMIRLRGGDPTVADGLRAAWGKRGAIAAWALLAASVGLLLNIIESALEKKGQWLARIVLWFVEASWNAITFFVVPVILFEEERSVGKVLGRSKSIFFDKWGETFVGSGSIGVAMFLVSLPVAALVYLVYRTSPVAGVAVGVLLLGTLAAVGSALSGIFNAALYRYATTGETADAFDSGDLADTFHARA
jgi:hypothetical protein